MTTSITCVTAGGHSTTFDAASILTADLREDARRLANGWIKGLRLVRYDGQSMRERFTYRGDSLWWFTELYLHKMRRLDRAIEAALALETLCAAHEPARIELATSDLVTQAVARAFGAARGLPIDVAGGATGPGRRTWPSYLVGLTARLSRLRPAPPIDLARSPSVVAFVHTAFWRASADDDGPQQEGYIGPTLDALSSCLEHGDLFCVGVGPRRNFRARRWWDPVAPASGAAASVVPIERLAPRDALRDALRLWHDRHALARELVSGSGIRAAGECRGLDLWPVLRAELEDAALVQWPWSARAMDEAAAAIARLQPQVVVTYAEAGGWGRALMLEARRREVPSVGLQHGFIYRHWLNYLHEPDEIEPMGADRGFPAPDRTLVFDGYAARHLVEAGHLPPERVVVTGSPRLDELAARIAAIDAPAREAIRRGFGVAADGRLVVLAAKFSELGDAFRALVTAVAERPGVRLVVKTHPAETPAPYREQSAGVANVTIAAADEDLARLLAAADGMVSRNSTVAIDGLMLDIPALVIGLPSNLSPLVEAGVMLGAGDESAIGRGLDALLYDREARRALADAARDFRHQHSMHADGRAAARAADVILEAGRRRESVFGRGEAENRLPASSGSNED